MLTKLQNPKIGYISRLLLLPLLTFLVVAFAVKTKEKTSPPAVSKLNRQITVVIDAGHGLRNGLPHGAKGLNGIIEDEISLAIAKKIGELNKDENLKLIFTRPDDNFVENRERIKIAEENKADLFISIHQSFAPKMKKGNGYVDNPANGFEIYIAKDGNPNLSESRELGSAIVNEMKNIMPIREPGVKQRQRGIWVIEAASCPAVLLECGFISNSKDAAFVTDEKNQEKIAEAVLKAIVNYAVVNEKKVNSDTLKNNVISTGNVTNYSTGSKYPLAKKGADKKNGVSVSENIVLKDSPKKEDTIPTYRTVFTKAEVMPSFPGGEKAWNRHIQEQIEKNINALIQEGKDGTCEVEFIVDTLGNVSRLTVKTMQNTKLASVLIEAIAKGPKWVPAIQNRRKVTCWKKEKLTFSLPDGVTKSKDANNGKQKEETEYWVSMAVKNSNTIYIGINNPFVISTGKIPADKITVTTNNGVIQKKDGQWITKPASKGEAIITISAKTANKTTVLQKFTFTVKNIPDPVISLAGSRGGRMSTAKFKSTRQLDIDEEWEIKGFVLYATGAGFDKPVFKQVYDGNVYNGAIISLMSRIGPGTTITYDEVIVKMKKADVRKVIPGIFVNLY